MNSIRLLALCVVPLATISVCAFEQVKAPAETPEKAALAKLNGLIGGWRGVGMPQRGSSRGAWQETSDWAWSFSEQGPALVYSVKNGKHLKSARLSYDPKAKTYELSATNADDSQRTFAGVLDENKLTLISEPDSQGQRHRVTITELNEKRMLVLLEHSIAEDQFFRTAEVGYTRAGTRLATTGANGPECVVTGGKATSPVTYMGKTYYVCCTGCRQAFEDDPAGIIAEFEAKVAARKAETRGN